MLSAILMIMQIKAQGDNRAHGSGVTIGTSTIPFTGGPVPTGVTPSVTIATIVWTFLGNVAIYSSTVLNLFFGMCHFAFLKLFLLQSSFLLFFGFFQTGIE
jgi:hypothetical protein